MQKYQNMKELLQQYSAYNLWANKAILLCVAGLSDEQQHKEIVSSFSSILKTLTHMMDVESVWWQRLKLSEHVIWPSAEQDVDFNLVNKRLLETSENWAEWVKQSHEAALNHVFEYRNSKKELFKQPVNEIVMQVVNHQTYHRGQLVTMLRQLEISKIPNMDFVSFCRTKHSS